MRVSSWQRGLHGVASALALGLVIGLNPNAVQAVCGDGVVDGGGGCVGDCNGDGSVTVDEIVTMVNAALNGGTGGCTAGDANGDGSITVDEIVTAVNNALNGCGTSGGVGMEDCDNGGLCVGGANAGTACTAEADCMGTTGACYGGLDNLRGCDSTTICREGVCRKCRTYGGDGCAANCTNETVRPFNLVPGVINPDQMSIQFGTSGAVVFGPFLTVPLALTGTQTVTVGKQENGSIPVVLTAAGINLDEIPVSNIACACVRGAESSTCGGTLFGVDGVQSPNCTPGFGGIETCPTDKPCTAVHGPGNTGSGFITCGSAGVDIDYTQDCNGTPGGAPLDPVVTVTNATGAVVETTGNGYFIITSAIGTVVGMCTGTTPDYGPDGMFCTNDDPVSNRGTPNSVHFTTRNVQATVLNPGDFEGDVLGPELTMGTNFICTGEGTSPTANGSNLAGAFTACDQPTVSDIAVPVNFAAQ